MKPGILLAILAFAFPFNISYAQFESNPLSQAVDNTQVDFITESPPFFRQTRVFSTGGDAAQAGNIGNNGVTVMAVEVQGPTTVSFDWRVSSEFDFDFLALVVLDQNFNATNIIEAISGTTSFRRVTVNIPAGVFFPTWGFIKDESVSSGEDTGWVDNIVIGNVVPESNTTGGAALPGILNLLLSDDT